MTTFLDFIRKVHQEKRQRDIVLKDKGKGPGPGWWGPPKGTHVAGAKAGGKITRQYFTSGKGKEIVKGLSQEERSAVINALEGSNIHPAHLENLKITTKPWKKHPDWEVPAGILAIETKPIAGIYDPESGTIHIKHDILMSDAGKWTLSHEIGHHVTGWGNYGGPEWTFEHINSMHSLLDGFEKIVHGSTADFDLTRMGLRKYSLTNDKEFMADCFKVYSQGSQLQKRALAKHLDAQSLEEIFGG